MIIIIIISIIIGVEYEMFPVFVSMPINDDDWDWVTVNGW